MDLLNATDLAEWQPGETLGTWLTWMTRPIGQAAGPRGILRFHLRTAFTPTGRSFYTFTLRAESGEGLHLVGNYGSPRAALEAANAFASSPEKLPPTETAEPKRSRHKPADRTGEGNQASEPEAPEAPAVEASADSGDPEPEAPVKKKRAKPRSYAPKASRAPRPPGARKVLTKAEFQARQAGQPIDPAGPMTDVETGLEGALHDPIEEEGAA